MLARRFTAGSAIPTTLILAVLLYGASVTAAEFERSFSYEAETLTVGNLIGAITIEGHEGSAFEILVRVQGEDAAQERIQFDEESGARAQLLIRFPLDEETDYVYPRMGSRSRSSFDLDDDGSWMERLFGGGDRIEVRGSGRGLEIWADVEIRVPRGSTLRVGHGIGEMEARAVEADLELAIRAGPIRASDISGTLSADTGSGHVEVDGIRGDLSVDTGSGHVDALTVEGRRVSIDTGSGHVRLEEARATSISIDTGSGNVDLSSLSCEELTVDTGSGGVEADRLGTDELEIDTGSGSVRVQLDRMGSGSFHVETGSGSITFMMPEGASARVSAETGSGGIDVDVTEARISHHERDEMELEVGTGEARVELGTGSGRIRVATR